MKTFFVSDHHFYHNNILKFEVDGNSIRPFDSLYEMHKCLIDRHNALVEPNDKVYFLGDVGFSVNATGLDYLSSMNGNKVLIMGNHDGYGSIAQYLKYFDKILSSKSFTIDQTTGILTHIPVHTSQLENRYVFNIHGHLHTRNLDDERYLNVSVEQNDFGPISLESVKEIFKRRGLLDKQTSSNSN